ncbi:NAD(P)-binding protein [Lophium mytilinum]|uniref:NAD(P)-binding protein n=1 Tax=Lophium mytilinum TaxID=390894 RepID=A0A6A6QMN5_9PEZI|nr:NAD(P)-binding protein [Lophium mytilinum]
MGKAVVEYLASEGWKVSIADIDEKSGTAVAKATGGLFNKTDVSNYDDMLKAFSSTFEKWNRLDFVFANAGILDPTDFYAESALPPPKPSYKSTDVNLNGAINSVYLSMHYMRKNPVPGGFILVTGSAAGIYANAAMPTYGAAKHGVVGLVRGAGRRLAKENIRVSTILPGPVNTNITTSTTVEIVPGGVNPFGDDVWTTTQNIIDAAMQLYNDPEAGGKVLEVSKGNFYEREQPDWADELMKKVLMGTVY